MPNGLPARRNIGKRSGAGLSVSQTGGRLIALGPSIKYLPGACWDFWGRHLALTELASQEALTLKGFKIERCIPRFLPYAMSQGTQYPLGILKLYLELPFAWPLFGKQFLVMARKE